MKTYSEIKEYKKGDLIIEAGANTDEIYIIKKGTAEVFKKDEDSEVIVNLITEGGVFGELGFILERGYLYSVRASSGLIVEVFDPRTFSQLYDTNVGLLLKPIIQSLAERVRHSENIIHESNDGTLGRFLKKAILLSY